MRYLLFVILLVVTNGLFAQDEVKSKLLTKVELNQIVHNPVRLLADE